MRKRCDNVNKKDNQRTRISKLLFRNALTDLIKEKGGVSKISVRELCERAELNRSTFYAHYSEPKDILNETESEILAETEEHLKKIGGETDAGANRYILSFLKFIRQNDKTFRVLLIDSADPEFRTRFMNQSVVQFVSNLRIDLPERIEQYVFSYILNGSTGIIIQWIRSDYSIDENETADLLFSINQSALKNLDGKL